MAKRREISERVHRSHPAIVKRLKRASGHLSKVIEMIESGRPCVELAQQLAAVESAIASAKKTLIHDHIEHCLDSTGDMNPLTLRSELKELKDITRFL